MAEERVERRLAAIFAAGMVAYSRFMEADKTGTLAQLKTLRQELLDPLIAANGVRAKSLCPLSYTWTDRKLSHSRSRQWPLRFKSTKFASLLVAILALAACATQPVSVSEVEKRWLSFLEAGQTTREDLIARFGIPSARFENDRIFTYRLSASDEGLSPSFYGAYQLVLVFDNGGRLAEHTLLQP